jgi:hypothetical protein
MRKNRKISHGKICFIFIILLISLAFSSVSYSNWSDDVEVQSYITSGSWEPCVKIRKTLEQGCPEICDDCFYMTIEAMNNDIWRNGYTNSWINFYNQGSSIFDR